MFWLSTTNKCGVVQKTVLQEKKANEVKIGVDERLAYQLTLGVFPFVFKALNNAFSAPRICTVLAGYLLRLVKLPA